jgi:hypothetical protein
MLIRDNKFDEFTLPDKISNTNMTHALARLSTSASVHVWRKIEGSAGFAIHHTGVGGFGFKLSSPAGVFSAELSALFIALRHIREVIQPPEKCLILTDTLGSIRAVLSRRISWRTHPLVYECKQFFTL